MKKGFTLLELLVVIAIIAILASVGLGSYTRSQAKARDARRRSDLKEIQNAAEQYYAVNGSYPTNYTTELAEYFSDKQFPTQPSGGNYEIVSGSDADQYAICAELELGDGGNCDAAQLDPSSCSCTVGSDTNPCDYFCVWNLQ